MSDFVGKAHFRPLCVWKVLSALQQTAVRRSNTEPGEGSNPWTRSSFVEARSTLTPIPGAPSRLLFPLRLCASGPLRETSLQSQTPDRASAATPPHAHTPTLPLPGSGNRRQPLVFHPARGWVMFAMFLTDPPRHVSPHAPMGDTGSAAGAVCRLTGLIG